MKAFSTLFLIFFGLSFASCNKDFSIVGKWNRIIDKGFGSKSDTIHSNWGDIEFKKDSTFFGWGDRDEDSTSASTPGWHIGSSFSGIWKIENNQLLLKPTELQINFYLRYDIIELSRNRLVLKPTIGIDNFTENIIYSRFK